jgi:hypothetical protein
LTIENNRAQDWLNVVLAIWLFISPWVLQFGLGMQTASGGATPQAALHLAAWNAWVLGVIVFLVALSASTRRDAWQNGSQEWFNLLLGIWIFVAPWVLGFSGVGDRAAAWDHWITGVLIFLVALWNLSTISYTVPRRDYP